MRPDFVQIVRHAHDLGLVVSIGSNGTYVTQRIIDELPREECFVSISLDGIEFQRELRVHSTFDDIRDRILLLKSNGIPTPHFAGRFGTIGGTAGGSQGALGVPRTAARRLLQRGDQGLRLVQAVLL